MNSWIFSIVWICVKFLLWLSTFTPSERVGLAAAFLVLIGVVGEYVIEIDAVEKRKRLRRNLKWLSMGLLLMGLSGDVLGIIMGQAEMATLTQETGNAKQDAEFAKADAAQAKTDAGTAHTLAQSASDVATPAKQTADAAKREADVVKTQAAELRQQMSVATQELADAESAEKKEEQTLVNLAVCMAPRTIPLTLATDAAGKPHTAADPLQHFATTQVIIEFVPDAEARRAAINLAKTLTSAGWYVIKFSAGSYDFADGVEVQPSQATPADFTSDNTAGALVRFLHSFNWEAKRGWPVDEHFNPIRDPKIIPPKGIRIRVGLYPPMTFVAAPGAKFLADNVEHMNEAMEKHRKDRQEWMAKQEEEMKKVLSPEMFAQFKAEQARDEAEEKQFDEEYTSPCEPLSGLEVKILP